MVSSSPATTVVARPSNCANKDGTTGPGAAGTGGGAAAGGAAGGLTAGTPDAAAVNLSRGRPSSRSFRRAVAMFDGALSTHALTGPDNAQPPTTNTASAPRTTIAAPTGAGSRSRPSPRTSGVSSD